MALFTPRIRAIMSGDGGGRRRGETGRAARRGERNGGTGAAPDRRLNESTLC